MSVAKRRWEDTCNPLVAWSMSSDRSCCPSHTRGQGWGWHHRVSNILIFVEAVSQCISDHQNLGGQTRPQPLHWKTERQRDIGTWKLFLYFVSFFLMFTKQIWNNFPCMADGMILITTTNMPSIWFYDNCIFLRIFFWSFIITCCYIFTC